jgi:hypothetical protein
MNVLPAFFESSVNSLAPTSPSIPTAVAVAIVLGYLQDFAKRLNSLPKINYYSNKLNSWIRLIATGAATVGVSWTWSSLPGGGHQWVWTIPTGVVIATGLWHWAVQYGMQHGWEILLSQRQVAKTAMISQATYLRTSNEPEPVEVPAGPAPAAKVPQIEK